MTDASHQVAPLFADAALARLLEGAEAASSRAFCRAAMEEYPKGGVRVIECAGGCGLFYGPSDPLNAVKGVGLHGPVSAEDWDRVEVGFRATGSPVVVDLCPLADEAFVAMLAGPRDAGGRGYAIGSFETVLCRRVDASSEAAPVLAEGAMIEVAGPERAAVWGRVLDLGFADGGEPVKMAVDIARVRLRLPHSIMLLASVNGEPAGGAGMSIHGDVAHMAGAAVLPEFRGRGLQRALTAARLRIARERGCTLAKLDVRAGTVSHKNAVRGGFQVAYTRPQLVKTW